MRTIRNLVVVVALLGAFAAPADAIDGAGCGGSYTKQAECGPIAIRGTPLTVHGDSTGTAAFVRVSVTVDGWREIPVTLCEAIGTSTARCSRDYPDAFTVLKVPDGVGTIRMRCHVTGSGSGTYSCHLGPKP